MRAHELIDQITTAVDEPPAGDAVRFHGADPVTPTRFLIGEAGAAAIGAAALAAARLHELRSGEAQHVDVAIDAAASAMRSTRYLRSSTPTEPRSGMANGAYELRDGRFFYFQRLFHHHTERQLEVLGCGPDEDSIVAAVRKWDGEELEEAIAGNGATGGYVRTEAEWLAHPQGQALAALPLIEITRIADSDPEPLPAATRPVSGVRVLDITRVLAGPTCGRTLAEHGADVFRVGTSAFPDNDQMMRDTGHGKRSVELDLKSRAGVEALEALIEGADVFSQGYRPGALGRLGFSPAELAERRPGIVSVSISAFGHNGPWHERRGFDSIVQAVSGIQHEGAVNGRPRFFGANALDFSTGYLAAFGAMTALSRRAREGGSFHVQVSLAQSGRWFQGAGRADPDAAAAAPPDLAPERIAELTISRETPFGTMQFLKPCAELSLTPGYWERPSVPLDHDRPEWL